MQKVIEINEFPSFKNDLNEVIKKLNESKNEINEVSNEKYNLDKYYQIIEGSDEDVLTQYKTWYDQLSEVVINNNNAIKQGNELVQQLEELNKFIDKEKENNDEIKVTLNSLVYKMIDKETIIFHKQEQNTKNQQDEKQIEFNKQNERLEKEKQDLFKKFNLEKEDLLNKFNMEKEELQNERNKRKQKYNEKIKELKNLKYQYDTGDYKIISTISNDENINFVPSINKMKEWSGKQHYNIIFDSKTDGDGSNNVLLNKVINKKNLYFIHFDNDQNIYGGYVNELIDVYNEDINDPNAFVFSLKRNNQNTLKKYSIKQNEHHRAFCLCPSQNVLYSFGFDGVHCRDITTFKVGDPQSYCLPYLYEYNGENNPLSFKSNNRFTIERILVIQMN
ncbi:TLDc domain-containing protein [Entamoeba marina]